MDCIVHGGQKKLGLRSSNFLFTNLYKRKESKHTTKSYQTTKKNKKKEEEEEELQRQWINNYQNNMHA